MYQTLFRMKRMKPIFPVLMTILLLLSVGCSKQEEITSYTVPKTDSGLAPAGSDSAMAPAKEVRMLAAILPGSPQNWFFKMTGSPEQVKAEFDRFVQFLKSVSMKAGKPEWKLPENWTQEPGSSMRFATLKVKDSDPPVELSVIPLPASSNLNVDLLSNINRWRDQVGLGNITEAQLKDASDTPALDTELFTVKAGDQPLTVVSLKGKMAANPMSRAPFASGMMGGGGRPAPGPVNPPAAAASPVKFETPKGWKPGRSGGMRKAAFNITEGDETGEVTIIDLAKDASPLLPNINRWRGQVGLKDITEAELPKQSEQLKAGDLEATYVKLIGPQEAILGAIIYRGNLAWFVKYKGSTKLAEQEEARFKQLVQSIRFK
ncbi:hypothetical protein Enr17x_07160 [Gimesia fumaroli]|uniref:Uncharacterized protein n=2 Tax=Gimesia fumaroli TaxID=2527976 RepID=A0A518I6J8_9PLAN|nr:hypothetical protein Enr17x_07160 [Gimesia fumaroli]